jgi:hypothetical protein
MMKQITKVGPCLDNAVPLADAVQERTCEFLSGYGIIFEEFKHLARAQAVKPGHLDQLGRPGYGPKAERRWVRIIAATEYRSYKLVHPALLL